MVTYSDLFTFVIMLCAVITLVITFSHKKQRPCSGKVRRYFQLMLYPAATVQIFVHVLRYTKAGGVYMSTYEELQDQTCADGIDVMDYEFNSPNIKGLYCNSTVTINNSI